MPNPPEFWNALERLLATHRLVIDRPMGSRHPHWPEVVYPLDYGYLEGTTAGDGGGVDVWVGTLPERTVTAIICSIDLYKQDVELKILAGCTAAEAQTIVEFHNAGSQSAILIPKSHWTARL